MSEPLKKQILDTIAELPDDCDDIEEVMYRLYVIDKIRKAQQASDNGDTIPMDDIKREADSW